MTAAITTRRRPSKQPRVRSTTLVLLLACGSVCTTGAADPPASNPDPILLRRCRVEFARASTLGTSLPGVLKDCNVRPGERVVAGQVLGRLRDDDVRAEWELRKVTGENPISVRLAERRKVLAETKLARARNVKRKGYVSDADLQEAETEAQVAQLDVDFAQQQLKLAQIQAKQAEAMLRFREFVTPHGGVVSEIFRTPGESVSPNFPVFRIVDDGQMQIIGQLDVVDAWRVVAGQSVRVRPTIEDADLPIEAEEFFGIITLVDGQIDTTTHTCKVLAEVANRSNLLRAGLEARMEILPRSGSAMTSKAGPIREVPRPGPPPATHQGPQMNKPPSIARPNEDD